MRQGASVTISGALIAHVRLLLVEAWKQVASGQVLRQGLNGYTRYGLPAFISAVAAVEAFVNEAFLSGAGRMVLKDSSLDALPREWLEERVDLRIKLLLVPQLATGRSLKRAEQPYQGMAQLVQVRNEIVHYKMAAPPGCVVDLVQRGIALKSKPGSAIPWPEQVSTSEGIRWAHNTACETVKALIALMPPDLVELWGRAAEGNFQTISKAVVKKQLRTLGLEFPGGA